MFGLRPFIDPFKMRTRTGPGDYNPKGLGRVRSVTISNKPQEKDPHVLRRIPGPGTYDDIRDNMHYKTIGGSKMGKDLRKSCFLNTPCYTNPGPGVHNCNFADK